MEKKLSVRLDAKQQRQLRQAATMLGKSMSELVREILQQALAERPICAKAGHLKGSLNLTRSSRDAWPGKLKEGNWRP